MREIAAFGLILFVLWLFFPARPARIPAKPSISPRIERQIDPLESHYYPNVLKQDGHTFKKVYEKGGKHIYYCTCGTKITYYGD